MKLILICIFLLILTFYLLIKNDLVYRMRMDIIKALREYIDKGSVYNMDNRVNMVLKRLDDYSYYKMLFLTPIWKLNYYDIVTDDIQFLNPYLNKVLNEVRKEKSKMKTYRAKTGVVDAWEFNEETKEDFVKWLNNNYKLTEDFNYGIDNDNKIVTVSIKTMYGRMRVNPDDIIVVYRDGQMSIYNKEEFEKIFEEIPSEERKCIHNKDGNCTNEGIIDHFVESDEKLAKGMNE